ncbi:MAG: MFS transporter [Gemmatimonadaceae bacterium]|nr:MFS transporter [Gemmatimonadaceae bacterium]
MNVARVGVVRWKLVGLLFALSATAYLDRVNISIAGRLMAAEYGFTNQQLGLVFSAFVLGYALFQVPSGRAADRFGARVTLTLAVIWWAGLSALTAAPLTVTVALPLLVLTRFLLGAGEAVMYPASNRIVARWIPVSERGLANGLIFTGVGVGAGISPPLITSIMLRFGWRASFVACALIGLVGAGAWWHVARDSPGAHRSVSAGERTHIAAGVPPGTSAPALSWRQIRRTQNVWLLTVSYFCYGYSAYIFFSWFFIYLSTVRGMQLRESARYAMLPFVAMAIGSMLGGVLNDRLSSARGRRMGRCGVAVAGIGLAAVFIAAGTMVESARVASVILAGGAGSLYLAQSSFWSVSADIAGPSAGAVSGTMNMGAQLGGVVTASLTPWIADHFGWAASFQVAAVLCVIGAAAWAMVQPGREIVSTA